MRAYAQPFDKKFQELRFSAHTWSDALSKTPNLCMHPSVSMSRSKCVCYTLEETQNGLIFLQFRTFALKIHTYFVTTIVRAHGVLRPGLDTNLLVTFLGVF